METKEDFIERFNVIKEHYSEIDTNIHDDETIEELEVRYNNMLRTIKIKNYCNMDDNTTVSKAMNDMINRHLSEIEELKSCHHDPDEMNKTEIINNIDIHEYQSKLQLIKYMHPNKFNIPTDIKSLSYEECKDLYNTAINNINNENNKYKFTYNDLVRGANFIVNNGLFTSFDAKDKEEFLNIFPNEFIELFCDSKEELSINLDKISNIRSNTKILDYFIKICIIAMLDKNINQDDDNAIKQILLSFLTIDTFNKLECVIL